MWGQTYNGGVFMYSNPVGLGDLTLFKGYEGCA